MAYSQGQKGNSNKWLIGMGLGVLGTGLLWLGGALVGEPKDNTSSQQIDLTPTVATQPQPAAPLMPAAPVPAEEQSVVVVLEVNSIPEVAPAVAPEVPPVSEAIPQPAPSPPTPEATTSPAPAAEPAAVAMQPQPAVPLAPATPAPAVAPEVPPVSEATPQPAPPPLTPEATTPAPAPAPIDPLVTTPAIPAVAAPIAPPAPIARAVPENAGVTIVEGVIHFYFATGKSALPDGAKVALASAVQAAKRGQYVVVSGYHDATGDAALNADLAKQRALSVRTLLLALGAPPDKIVLLKPQDTTGSAAGEGQSNAQARRVDVSIANKSEHAADAMLVVETPPTPAKP